MHVHLRRRSPARVTAWLEAAGFRGEAEMVQRPARDLVGGFVFAHR
ncbi:hypothetical protein V1634_28665 [Plantactinospora veratri]|uniref:Uncharacterized protein n=1 Tax=Plantactinospora veratri TaxID=1436122 RepID=A0ABU7SLH4_9ACTN